MSRSEFIQELKIALENDLVGSIIQENIDYYNSYILEEIKKGRMESEVLAELGDPWMIARTIIDSVENNSQGNTYEASESTNQSQAKDEKKKMHIFGLDTWWKKGLALIIVIVAIMATLAITAGIIRLILPILLPILFVIFAIRIFKQRK
ncbi:MAG: hypothetical protein RSD97_10745 [Lachnospiraceae bacterium]